MIAGETERGERERERRETNDNNDNDKYMCVVVGGSGGDCGGGDAE